MQTRKENEKTNKRATLHARNTRKIQYPQRIEMIFCCWPAQLVLTFVSQLRLRKIFSCNGFRTRSLTQDISDCCRMYRVTSRRHVERDESSWNHVENRRPTTKQNTRRASAAAGLPRRAICHADKSPAGSQAKQSSWTTTSPVCWMKFAQHFCIVVLWVIASNSSSCCGSRQRSAQQRVAGSQSTLECWCVQFVDITWWLPILWSYFTHDT